METPLLATLDQHFGDLTDPRVERTKLHQLVDILVIAICAVIGGADNWEDVEAFGKAKQEWFQTFLELPNGIPSHDTFTRVFARLDPEQFQTCFVRWIAAVSQRIGGQVIAIDGKVLRRSHDHGIGQAAIDMVSAWAVANRLVLGQVKVTEKSNELTAIPRLLEALEISGWIVTIDAMGCQTDIAQAISDRDADYVLALKDNQGQLYEDVQLLFNDLEHSQYRASAFDHVKTVEKGHGRIEIRECWTISDPTVLCHLRAYEKWANLQTVSRIRAQRWIGDEKVVKTAILSRVSRAPRAFSRQSGRTGALRMNCIGHWISLLTKMVPCSKRTWPRKLGGAPPSRLKFAEAGENIQAQYPGQATPGWLEERVLAQSLAGLAHLGN